LRQESDTIKLITQRLYRLQVSAIFTACVKSFKHLLCLISECIQISDGEKVPQKAGRHLLTYREDLLLLGFIQAVRIKPESGSRSTEFQLLGVNSLDAAPLLFEERTLYAILVQTLNGGRDEGGESVLKLR